MSGTAWKVVYFGLAIWALALVVLYLTEFVSIIEPGPRVSEAWPQVNRAACRDFDDCENPYVRQDVERSASYCLAVADENGLRYQTWGDPRLPEECDRAIGNAGSLAARTLAEVLIVRGNLYQIADRPDAAARAYGQALSLDSDNSDYLGRRISALWQGRERSRARADARLFIRQNPDDIAGHWALVDLLKEAGRGDAAAEVADRFVARHPNHPRWRQFLQFAYEGTNRDDPDRRGTSVYFQFGETGNHCRSNAAADIMRERIARPDLPRHMGTYSNILAVGQCDFENARYGSALAALERLIAMEPDDAGKETERRSWAPFAAVAFALRGRISELRGDRVAAEQNLRAGIEADPEAGYPHLSRARFYKRQGRWAEALADYDRALEVIDPRRGNRLLVERAEVRRRIGESREQ